MAWRETTLGELLTVKHGFAFLGEHFADTGTHIVLTPGNFNERGGFRSKGEKEKWYTGPIPAEYVLRRGDILIAMTEQAEGLLGSSAIVPCDDRYLHNQRLGLVQVRSGDPGFIYHLFNLPSVRQQIRASASGAKIRHTAPSRVAEVRVRVPEDVAEQRRIAETLSAYDDLIENCERRIRVLDEMARALYREWFVLFRYPGHEKGPLVDSPMGRIPSGWAVAALEDGIGIVQDGDWIETKDQGGEDYRLLQISNVGVGAFVETGNYRYVTAETFTRLRCTEVAPGDILVARMPTPIGRAWLVTPQPWRMITAVDVAIVRTDPCRALPSYLVRAWNDDANLRRIAAQASGTTRLRITRRELAALPFVIPPLALQEEFDARVAPQNALAENLRARAANLRKTRDLLLPRLLSGQVTIEG